MASRSEKLRRRQRRKEKKGKRHRGLEAWSPPAGTAIVVNPPGEAKMSEALWALVEPEHAELADEEQDLRKLLTLGVTAWNAALLDREGRTALLDSLAQTFPPEIRQDFHQLVEPLIRRKEKLFPHIQRPIISFKLTRLATGEPYLSVISGLSQRA